MSLRFVLLAIIVAVNGFFAAAEVSLVSTAGERRIPVVPRGQAHTQSGQATTEGGVLLDTSSLCAIHEIDATAERGGAMRGREVTKTVLIVEDNELNMKLFHDLLEAHGYATVGTRNGVEAIDLARTHRPDLILMDIQLPEVSGLEVTKWIKDDPDLHAIPVIAVTAFAMKGDEERIRQGGCEAYLSKPISVGKFIETIRRFLAVPEGDRR